MIQEEQSNNVALLSALNRCGHFLYHRRGGKMSQVRILRILSERERRCSELGGEASPGLSQLELQQILDIRSGSVSEIIGKMEASGLICKTRQETDRRKVHLALTDQGRVYLEEAQQNRIRQEALLFESLTVTEQGLLLNLLEKLLMDWETKFDPALFHGRHPGHDSKGGRHV